MSDLVLKKFRVDENATEMVVIEGRNAGFLSWLLTILGVDNTVALTCSNEKIVYKQSSIFGSSSMTIPLQAVSAIIAGTKKPKQLLAYALLTLIGTGWAITRVDQHRDVILGAGLIVAIIFVVIYSLSKSMGIFIQNGGDTNHGLQFKASVIENVTVDSKKVNKAIEVINKAVLKKNTINSHPIVLD